MKKTIIVTGASRGIGFETALKLAESGHQVVAVARSGDKLQELSNQAKNGNITTVETDLTTEAGIQKISDTLKPFDRIDGLINNAGSTIKKEFMKSDISDFQKMMDINLLAPVRLIQAVKPKMAKGSHIVNISSMSGFQGAAKFPGLSAYGAAKAALTGLSESLSQEFVSDGISVNCLCIGAVQTEMLGLAFPGYDAPVSAAQMGEYLADFVLTAHQFYNGKVLPVALSDPD